MKWNSLLASTAILVGMTTPGFSQGLLGRMLGGCGCTSSCSTSCDPACHDPGCGCEDPGCGLENCHDPGCGVEDCGACCDPCCGVEDTCCGGRRFGLRSLLARLRMRRCCGNDACGGCGNGCGNGCGMGCGKVWQRLRHGLWQWLLRFRLRVLLWPPSDWPVEHAAWTFRSSPVWRWLWSGRLL